MATIGLDCELILDGTGYFAKPGSYQMRQSRIRKANVRADAGEAYVDLGPGKRVWSMTILCINELTKYDGATLSTTGQQFRDALRTSFTGSTGTTINFQDFLGGSAVAVHFDSYLEAIIDPHNQLIAKATGGSLAASYEISIELVEA